MDKFKDKFPSGYNWAAIIWIGLMHIASILIGWYVFTWVGLIIFLTLSLATGFGVTLGYHRYLTHGSFKTIQPIRWLLLILGQLSGEGTALNWVAHHRKHHALTDVAGDPHSPHEFKGWLGFWWGHMLWMGVGSTRKERDKFYERWAPDLFRDRLVRFLDKTFLLWHLIFGLTLLGSGWLIWGAWTGISMLVWGVFVRIVVVFHTTWCINSVTHLWGYRNFATMEKSTNFWPLALPTLGEAWHNNHHADQLAANHGVKWWEVMMDPTYWIIKIMSWLGLAWDVKKHRMTDLIKK